MFLYLMDGCYDWWKEIMQKKFSSGGFICHGKREGRQSNCTTHEQEHWDFLTTGRFTRNSIPIATSGGEESLFEILRVTTAPSCMLHSTWSSLNADHGHAAAFCALSGLRCFGSNFLAIIFCDLREKTFPHSRKIHPLKTYPLLFWLGFPSLDVVKY